MWSTNLTLVLLYYLSITWIDLFMPWHWTIVAFVEGPLGYTKMILSNTALTKPNHCTNKTSTQHNTIAGNLDSFSH